MKLFCSITFFLMINGCSRSVCPPETTNNQKKYLSYLRLISETENGKQPVLVDSYFVAIDFLSLVTGINSKADYSSTFGYRKREDFEIDMALWKKWYKKNKCKLTDAFVDSVSNQYSGKSSSSK